MTKLAPSELLDKALDAFWQVVVEEFPEAITGDVSPWQVVRLHIAAEAAIEEWIEFNVTSKTRTTPCKP